MTKRFTPPTEMEINRAIEYALRCEPVSEITPTEDGDYEVEILEALSLEPFVMCLLRELNIIDRGAGNESA